MRGDRPSSGKPQIRFSSAPPHARGSTRVDHRRRRAVQGSPACAGIDPSWTRRSWPDRRLPRMRGDRPVSAMSAIRSVGAPPHARGSTRTGTLGHDHLRGSPACAGIDPPRSVARSRRSWAPPHARGSTLPAAAAGPDHPGSPACAGIDRRADHQGLPRLWLPRMRGDRPSSTRVISGTPTAPPHARGSTHDDVGRAAAGRGSPACAGIDPIVVEGVPLLGRLPRMRGDRPSLAFRRGHAPVAPPHTRGWTEDGGGRALLRPGSPACAGIDSCRPYVYPTQSWLPRMRGD